MKINRITYLCLLVIIALIIPSCGDDNTTTPNTPTSSVLFTWDTLQAVVTNTGFSSNSTSFTQTISATQVRIEYRLQSNADSSAGAFGSYLDSTNGSPVPPSPMTINIYAPIDTSYSFIYNVPTQPFYAGFKAQMFVSQNTVLRYLRLINIKITKVQ
jgi:hypothetical protein